MENNQPLVSVIINCYNSDKYLNEAIDSVIAQTYQNWEIIFWDNQSIDRSAEIVKSYVDSRIKYFYAPNHTVLGEARNLAVGQALGKWIGFLDCDDVWYSNKLEIQLENILFDDFGMIYSRMEFLLENSGKKTKMANSIKQNYYPKKNKLPTNYIFEQLLFDCFIPLPSVLIKKKLFDIVGGIDSSLKVAEDYDIFLKIANISSVKAIDRVLCKYRVHSNNLSHRNENVTFLESLDIISKYNKLNNENVGKAIIFWRIKMHYKLKSSVRNFFYYLVNVMYYKYKKLL